MFCVECGAEGPTVGGLCPRCFAKRHPLVEPPAHVDLPRCRQCGALRFRAGWSRVDLEKTIPRLLEEKIPPLPPYPRARFTAAARPEDEANFLLAVTASGAYEGVEQTQTFRVRLRLKPSLCDTCARQSSKYYEGILQVRADDRDLTEQEVRTVRTLVLSRVDRTREEAGDFVSKVEEVRGGMDFYLSTNALGTRLAKEIAEAMGGTVTASPKLYGQRQGKELYRVTTLVRLPAFRVGDVVRHRGALAEVVEVRPFMELRDLASGQVRRFKAKDLRGVHRVDAERFEAELRAGADGRVVAVHPDSGAERPLRTGGAKARGRKPVVWAADGVYLSAIRAAGSKD